MSFKRLFFHNQHDINSVRILETLESDIFIVDVFDDEEAEYPSEITLSYLPYLVDKYFQLETEKKVYNVGEIFQIEVTCRDYLGQLIQNEKRKIDILVEGALYQELVDENGKIFIELECSIPKVIGIHVNAENYLPLNISIEVVDYA